MILAAIDNGFLTKTKFGAQTIVTLRILFPHGAAAFCNRFDLTDTTSRKVVRDELMPVMIATRDVILAEPARLEEIIRAHQQKLANEQRAAKDLEKTTRALGSMKPDEQEVIMFGERLWPLVDARNGTYNYDQLCTAVWTFMDWNRCLHRENTGSRAILVRLNTWWCAKHFGRISDDKSRWEIKQVYSLIVQLSILMERSPDAPCRPMPTPKVEGDLR